MSFLQRPARFSLSWTSFHLSASAHGNAYLVCKGSPGSSVAIFPGKTQQAERVVRFPLQHGDAVARIGLALLAPEPSNGCWLSFFVEPCAFCQPAGHTPSAVRWRRFGRRCGHWLFWFPPSLPSWFRPLIPRRSIRHGFQLHHGVEDRISSGLKVACSAFS